MKNPMKIFEVTSIHKYAKYAGINKQVSFFSLITMLGGVVLFTGGCATWNKWMGNEPENTTPLVQQPTPPPVDENLRFSENPNIGTFNERRYKRATRKSLEEDSDVGSRAGSLWNNEGPSSYLFTQNKVHREGDLLNVKLEGNAKSQMDSKIQVIKKLLTRIEIVPTSPAKAPGDAVPLAENAANSDGRAPASVANNGATPNGKAGESAAATANGAPTASSAPGAKGNTTDAAAASELDAPIQVDSVATRVTERMADGNYRVKGQQSFMIGKKEFKVIITGLVRPEDFIEEGISSNKLLDPQLDIVSLRRSLQ